LRSAIHIGIEGQIGLELVSRGDVAGVDPAALVGTADNLAAAERRALPGARLSFHELDATRSDLQNASFIVLCAGRFLQQALGAMSAAVIAQMIEAHLQRPLAALARALALSSAARHLVVIGSSSSWKMRKREALYCALRAAQVTLARTLVPELLEAHPDNRVTLVNPSGLAVPSFCDSAQPVGGRLDASSAATAIWAIVLEQRQAFLEIQLSPAAAGGIEIGYGARMPESPI
jgi:hypothetical protein